MVDISHFFIDGPIPIKKDCPMCPTQSAYSPLTKLFQLKTIRRGEPQKRAVNHPVPYIVIKTSPSINPLLHLLRKMGVAEDDHIKPF
jgi:hypothetical protein